MRSEVEHVRFAFVSHDLSDKVSAADGISFTASDRAAYTLAKARGLDGFESGGIFWTVESIESGTALLHTSDKADAVLITDLSFITYDGGEVPDHKTKTGLVRSASPVILSDGGVIYRGSEPYMLVTRLTIVMSSPDTAVSAEFADALTAAFEALGLRTSRRIVHHLIPNVMGQIIVCGASGLGNVILTEAALSFLGLGIRYPSASWENMVSSVTDTHVLTNCPFAWIPAGMFILVTVLGFNFIGDHVRDRPDR